MLGSAANETRSEHPCLRDGDGVSDVRLLRNRGDVGDRLGDSPLHPRRGLALARQEFVSPVALRVARPSFVCSKKGVGMSEQETVVKKLYVLEVKLADGDRLA